MQTVIDQAYSLDQIRYQDIKQSIPETLFVPSLTKSLFYFFWDFGIIFLLSFLKWKFDSIFFDPLYWFLQGTMFWALFVVGHDCGHGSFSQSSRINYFFGHLAHTFLLVPFHGWRISHQTHHNHHGDVERDESWHPISKTQYDSMNPISKFLRFKLFLIVFPLYLFVRSSGRDGSHFLPGSDLFKPYDKKFVVQSTIWWSVWICCILFLGVQFGIWNLISYYVIPYFVFVIWLSLVTFLHHTDSSIPWYRGNSWSFVKGAFSTIDRKYGIFEWIHHNIGTHTVHHLFPKIPHYHLLESQNALLEHSPEFVHRSKAPIIPSLWKSSKECKYVDDSGTIVFYKS